MPKERMKKTDKGTAGRKRGKEGTEGRIDERQETQKRGMLLRLHNSDQSVTCCSFTTHSIPRLQMHTQCPLILKQAVCIVTTVP
jgi:hypothetical protein